MTEQTEERLLDVTLRLTPAEFVEVARVLERLRGEEPAERVASPWIPRLAAAEYLGISSRTLDRLVLDGRISAYYYAGRRGRGRAVRFRREDIDALLTEGGES